MRGGLGRWITSLDCMTLFCFVFFLQRFTLLSTQVWTWLISVLHTCLIYSASTITQGPQLFYSLMCVQCIVDQMKEKMANSWMVVTETKVCMNTRTYSFLYPSLAWVKAVVYRWVVLGGTAILKRCSCDNSEMSSGSVKPTGQEAQGHLLLHDCAGFTVTSCHFDISNPWSCPFQHLIRLYKFSLASVSSEFCFINLKWVLPLDEGTIFAGCSETAGNNYVHVTKHSF